jgi:transcriptional regulator with XRE-family HTH domain
MAPRYAELGSAIKSARLRKGLTQEQAAQQVGTSRFHWIRWEQGLHKPEEHRARLIEVLGLPEDVFGDEDDDDEADDPMAAERDLVAAQLRYVRSLVRAEIARGSR